MLCACGGKRKSYGVTEYIVVKTFGSAIDVTVVGAFSL